MGILQIQFRHDQLNQLKGPFQNQQQLTGIWTSKNLLLGIYFILAGVGSHKAALGIDPEHQGLRWDQTRSSAYTTTQKYNGNKEKQTKRSLSTRKRQRFPASNIQTRHYMVNYEVREEWDTKCNGNPKKHARESLWRQKTTWCRMLHQCVETQQDASCRRIIYAVIICICTTHPLPMLVDALPHKRPAADSPGAG